MNDDHPGSAPHQREDPRPAHTRQVVLQAARLIIGSEGQGSVTPTRLAELSGVARSTIYRHWPDTTTIIIDAMANDARRGATPNGTGDPAEDLRGYLHELRDMLDSPGSAIIAAQVDIAERDDQAAEMLANNGSDRSAIIGRLLDDPRPDFAITHAQLVAPLFFQRYFMRKPITDELIDTIVDNYVSARPDRAKSV